MAQRPKLKVEKRQIEGKKVKKLRREGILPGNIYGHEFKSTSVQTPLADFKKVFEEAGETTLVDLALGEQTIPVLIHNIHTDFRNNFLHADFYKVNLKEKVKAMIPIELLGEAKAVIDKIGLLMHVLNELEVEALPTDLPEKIEVDVSPLSQIDEQITVADLKLPPSVEVLSDPSQIVVKVGELVTKEAQAEAEAEVAAVEAAKAEATAAAGEGVEGTPAAQGEAPAEQSEQVHAPTEDKNAKAGEAGEQNKKEEPPKEEKTS